MDDVHALAERLLALEHDRDALYVREIEPILRSPDRGRILAPLIMTALTSSSSRSRDWICDLLAYVSVADLEAISEVAERCLPRSTPTPSSSDIDAFFGALLAKDTVPESVLEDCRLQLGRGPREDDDADAVDPLAPPFHWAVDLEARIRTASTSADSMARRFHPTWVLDHAPTASHATLGGGTATLPGCVQLFSLDALGDLAPAFDGVGRFDVLVPIASFGGSFGQTGPTSVFHDTEWRPTHARGEEDPGALETSDWDRDLVPAHVRFVPTESRYVTQDWSISNRRQNLNRLFGRPTFVQGPEYPDCPKCRGAMPLLLQIELGVPCRDGYDLVDDGIAYGFVCARCRVTTWLHQCT